MVRIDPVDFSSTLNSSKPIKSTGAACQGLLRRRGVMILSFPEPAPYVLLSLPGMCRVVREGKCGILRVPSLSVFASIGSFDKHGSY